MNIASGIAVYVITWWMVFFCALPFGIQNVEKSVNGSMPGAPVSPGLKKKALATTVIASFLWVAIYLITKSDLISFRDVAERMSL